MKASTFAALLLSLLLPTLTSAAGPWYFGASAGSADYGSQFFSPDALIIQNAATPGFDGTQSGLFQAPNAPLVSASSTGYDLFAGYRLSAYWALEAHYLDMGSAESDQTLAGFAKCTAPTCAAARVTDTLRVSAKTDGFMASVVGSYPITGSWSAFATAGLLSASTTVTTSVASLSSSRKGSKNVLDLGAGVQYGMGSDWALRLSWQQLRVVGTSVSSSSGSGNVNFTFLSVLYSL